MVILSAETCFSRERKTMSDWFAADFQSGLIIAHGLLEDRVESLIVPLFQHFAFLISFESKLFIAKEKGDSLTRRWNWQTLGSERVWQSTAWSKEAAARLSARSIQIQAGLQALPRLFVFSFAYRFIPAHLINTSDRGQGDHNLADAACLQNKGPSLVNEWAYVINLWLLDINGDRAPVCAPVTS